MTDPKEDIARANLDRLIRERGADFASLSRLLNRNAAYVQQYIRRKIPRKLDEDDRATLAKYFDVEESFLGGRDPADPDAKRINALVLVPRLEIGASAGPGGHAEDSKPQGEMGFDPKWLRGLGTGGENLSLIQVAGDSMSPTLADGDDIMVDRDDAGARVRDGIYVLRVDDVLVVKRLGLNPVARRITIKSDNVSYPDFPDCNPDDINVIGRVVWAGRKLG